MRPKTGRRMYITKDDVDRMGMTPGCKGCIAAKNNWAPKNHTEACRTRMETAVSAYDKERFEKALHRYTVAQAKVVEQEDKKAKEEHRAESNKRSRTDVPRESDRKENVVETKETEKSGQAEENRAKRREREMGNLTWRER